MNESKALAYAVIAWLFTTLLMWMFVSFLIYIATDLTYKQALTVDYQMIFVLFVYWWLPSLFVGAAVKEHYEI
jgi:hypothetical protein